jgi:hypothetical protein
MLMETEVLPAQRGGCYYEPVSEEMEDVFGKIAAPLNLNVPTLDIELKAALAQEFQERLQSAIPFPHDESSDDGSEASVNCEQITPL